MLSAPVPQRPILRVRLLAVALSTLLVHALWPVPIANVGVLSGCLWLSGRYAFPFNAAFAAAGAGWLWSLILVERRGAPRNRTPTRVLAALLGGASCRALRFEGRLFEQLGSPDLPDSLVARPLHASAGLLTCDPLAAGADALPALPLVCVGAWSGAAAVGAQQKHVPRDLFGKCDADVALNLEVIFFAAPLSGAAALLRSAFWPLGRAALAVLLRNPLAQRGVWRRCGPTDWWADRAAERARRPCRLPRLLRARGGQARRRSRPSSTGRDAGTAAEPV